MYYQTHTNAILSFKSECRLKYFIVEYCRFWHFCSNMDVLSRVLDKHATTARLPGRKVSCAVDATRSLARNLFRNSVRAKKSTVNCKRVLDSIKEKGHHNTADEVYSILNQIFKYAIAYNLIQKNPLAVIPYKQHTRTNGKRLTLEEERLLLDKCAPKRKCIFAIYLYCGIRPGELKTVRIEEPFVICQNTKQKEQKYAEKKIPITQNLRKYLDPEILKKTPKIDRIRTEFNEILPNHTLKDCRRTFNSHCKECGVNEDVRKLFMGHSLGGKIALAYTEFTDEFLLKEAAKLNY